MNVLVISHTYISPINRLKWQELAKHYKDAHLTILVPSSWKTSFFNVTSGDLSQDSLKNCQFVSLPTYATGNELLYFYAPLKFAKLLRTTKPDIIHVEQGLHAVSYFQAIFFKTLLRLKARCCFFTWVNWQPQLSFKTKMLTRIMEFFNARGSAGAIAGNSDAKTFLTATKSTLPVMVLPQLGISPKLFRPALISELDGQKKIAYIGRIIEEKGLESLVKAFAQLADEFADWQLVIIGAGNYEKHLIDYTLSKKLLHRIEFQAPVPHEKIATILRTVDILVLPSLDKPDWREQFGHVLIEAMASKVCVIGSNAGEIPNVIADTGIIFKQGDEQALCEALHTLIVQPTLRKQLAQKGYDRVMQEYTHSVIAEKTYNFWQSLLKS